MVQFKQPFVQDLTQPIKIRHCGSTVFNADNESNVVSVSLFNGSEPVAISGSVVGAVVCPDGATVPLTGSYSGNTASITLTGDCFAMLGEIGVGIQIVNGTQRTTVLKAKYNVETLTTENVVDPGSRITLEVGDLVDDIETATAAIPASDMASLMFGIAPTFSDSVAYKAGAYVYYGGDLYCFTADHNSGTWTGSDVTAAVLCNDVSDLKSNVTEMGTPPKIVEPEETEADLYVCDSDGNVIAKFVDGHIVTKNFDSASIQLDLIMEADSDEADLYIADSFGNVVAEFKDGHIVTKNFDSADMNGIPGDVETLQTEVAALQSATSGILYRNKDATDGVYAACRYHQPNLSSKQFCLLIAGDVHADRTRTQNMVEYLNALDAFDAGIMLGDISGNEYTDTIAFYLEALENTQKPFLTVLGNHDVGGAASDAAIYTKFGDCFQYAQLASGEAVSGKCYYYKDFTAQKIRVIVLMQYDLAGRASDTGDLCFGQDQINWFIGVLNSTPSDYGVIIAEHTNPSRHMTYNMDLSVTSDTWRQSNYAPTVMDGDPVPDIVNAWINGTTLSQTYSYTFDNPPSPLSVSADFTSRGAGEFITYLGGHWHMDVLGTPTTYTDQPDYHTPAAGLVAARQGDIPRKTGTRSEDSLSAVAVDRDKKTVKVFHVGAHFTKDAVDRLYFKYTYGA